MSKRLTAFASACLALTSASAASELAPSSGHSIRLAGFTGVVYYTAEADGYRVVATLASGAEDQPIRFASTLKPGQRMLISVPQAVGEPSLDFEIQRHGDVLVVSDPTSVAAADLAQEASSRRALAE